MSINDQLTAIDSRLSRIEEMLCRLAGAQAPPPPVESSDAARIIALARIDRGAAITEARRLSKQAMRAAKNSSKRSS